MMFIMYYYILYIFGIWFLVTVVISYTYNLLSFAILSSIIMAGAHIMYTEIEFYISLLRSSVLGSRWSQGKDTYNMRNS